MSSEEQVPYGFDPAHAAYVRENMSQTRRTLRSASGPRPGSRAASREGMLRRMPSKDPPVQDSAVTADRADAAAGASGKCGLTELEADMRERHDA